MRKMGLEIGMVGLAIFCFITALGCLGFGIKEVLDRKDVVSSLAYLGLAISAIVFGLMCLGVL